MFRIISKRSDKMKRIICIFLVFALCFALFACGKKQDETASETEISSSELTAQSETEKEKADIIATIRKGDSPRYAASPEDSRFIADLLTGEMHETAFSGYADYEITVGGNTYYYDASSGEIGSSSVKTLSGEQKEMFDKALERTVSRETPVATPLDPAERFSSYSPTIKDEKTTVATTIAVTGTGRQTPSITSQPGVQYIRTNESGYMNEKYPKVVIIKSADELENYISANSDKYYFGSGSGSSSSFNNAVKKYDDDFFSENALVMVVTRESSGSVYYDGVSVNGNEGIIAVYRFRPDVCTADMASWHIIIELDKNDPIFSKSPGSIQVLMSE